MFGFFEFVQFEERANEDRVSLGIGIDFVGIQLREEMDNGVESSGVGEKEEELVDGFERGGEAAFKQCLKRWGFRKGRR